MFSDLQLCSFALSFQNSIIFLNTQLFGLGRRHTLAALSRRYSSTLNFLQVGVSRPELRTTRVHGSLPLETVTVKREPSQSQFIARLQTADD